MGACPLTPREEAELEEVVLDVDIVDLDKKKKEVESLSSHPCQGAEKAGVQQGSSDLAEPLGAGGQRRAQQEAAVEQEQRGQEVHVDLGRAVPQPLPARQGEGHGVLVGTHRMARHCTAQCGTVR